MQGFPLGDVQIGLDRRLVLGIHHHGIIQVILLF